MALPINSSALPEGARRIVACGRIGIGGMDRGCLTRIAVNVGVVVELV